MIRFAFRTLAEVAATFRPHALTPRHVCVAHPMTYPPNVRHLLASPVSAVLAAKAMIHPPTLAHLISASVQSPTAQVSKTVSTTWRWWFGVSVAVVLASITFFLVLEFSMLAQGRPQDTLSAQVWRLIGAQTALPVSQWGAVRLLMLILWLTMWVFVDLVIVWLTGHFFWHVWA